MTAEIDFAYDGDSDHKERAETYVYENTYGNLLQKINYGEVNGNNDGTFTDVGTDIASTSMAYIASTSLYVVGLPVRDRLEDQSGNKVVENRYLYDDLPLKNIGKGNLTREDKWMSETLYAEFEKVYNSYGLITREKDPRDKATDYEYDTYNLYISATTNTLSQETGYTYDYSSGKVKEITDANNNTWQNIYDPLDRILTEKEPHYGTSTSIFTKRTYDYDDTSSIRSVKATTYMSDADSINDDWYNTLWQYRKKITIDEDEVDDDLTDFPIYIDLDDLDFYFWNSVNDDCGDVRITSDDGETELPREIVTCATSTSDGELWFKGNISDSTDTDFYIYYGNSNASDYATDAIYGAENVWGNDYDAVYHLQENSGSATDSTANDENGTFNGDLPDSQTGQIGDAQDFDGSGDYVSVASSDGFDLTNSDDFVISFWAKWTADTNKHMISLYDSSNGHYIVARNQHVGQKGRVSFYIWDNPNIPILNTSSSYNDNTLRLFHAVRNRTDDKIYVYVNGSKASGGGVTDTLTDFSLTNPKVHIGMWENGYQSPWSGMLDEVRLYKGLLSDAWMSTEYNNQSSPEDFYDFSPQEIKGNDIVKFDTINYIDGLDRDIQIRKETEGSNKYSVKDFGYNENGLLERETIPYISEGASSTSFAADDDLFVDYVYDPLDRVLNIGDTIGTTTDSYNNWNLSIIDKEGNISEYHEDADGNLVKVINGEFEWFSLYWPYRKKITIDEDEVDDDLTDFPIYIDLDDLDFYFWNSVNDDCGDVRITSDDGETELPREIVTCATSTSDGELWFKGNISDSTDTDFYIYYGNSNASDYATDAIYGAENVWGNDYDAVYHLQENSGSATDSTANDENGTFNGDLPDSQTGQIGDAQDFDGSGDYVSVASSDGFDLTNSDDFVISFWAKWTADTNKHMISLYDSSNGHYIVARNQHVGQKGRVSFYIWDNPNIPILNTSSSYNDNTLRLFHAVRNRTDDKIYVYVNGSKASGGGVTDTLTDFSLTNPKVHIGMWENGYQSPWSGMLDEVRLYKGLLSDAWMSTEYNNQSSPEDFYAVDSQEHSSLSSSSSAETNYEYSVSGNLLKITNGLDNERNLTYDGLGRLTKSEELHNSSDSYFGSSTFVYDDSGNLTSKTDAKGQIVSYTYDGLNRVLTENYAGQSGTEVQYSYDNCENGIGRLCSVSTSDITTFYEYNKLGMVSKETRQVRGVEYETEFTYDSFGNTTNITNPDNSQIRYVYNSVGLLEEVAEKDNSESSYSNIIESFNYDPLEKTISKDLANNTQEFYTYDLDNMYRLAQKETIAPFAVQQMMMGQGESMSMASIETETLFSEAQAIYNEDGSIDLKEEIELEKKRTKNSKTYLLGYDKDGKQIRKTNFYPDKIHKYDKEEEKFKDASSLIMEETSGYWSGNSLSYDVKISKVNTENMVEFENNGQKLFLSPLVDDINMGTSTFISVAEGISSSSNSIISSSTAFDSFSSTTEGELSSEKNIRGEIFYDKLLDKNIDLVFTVNDNYFSKEALINKKQALKNYKDDNYLEIPFRLNSNRKIDLIIDGQSLFNEKEIISSSSAKIIDNRGISTYVWPPKAEDDSGKIISISIKYVYGDDGIYLIKLLPTEWLKKASYPVRTDATISPYSGSGDGVVMRVDEYMWEACRNNSYGDASHDATPTITTLASNDGEFGSYILHRGFLPFDTSALLEDDVVSSTKLYFYVESTVNEDNDGYDYLTVVQGSQASPLLLTQYDYGEVGDIEGIDSGDRLDITSLGTGWNYFDLNSTGISWIDATGYTKFALREGHDLADVPPDTGRNEVEIRSSDYSGTSSDPYLQIIYTATQDSPTIPTVLQIEDKNSPVTTEDETPEFSAIYNDPDLNDIAESYRMQVTANVDYWEDFMVWDSGKTALTSSTTQGERCPNISYGGSSLDYDKPYYWRIKFWDDEDNEGDWSVENSLFVITDDVYIQDLSYNYDYMDNIIRITDSSETDTKKILDSNYDSLYRLIRASTTDAIIADFLRTYEYDSIGNLTNKSDQGSYSYTGDQGTSYANPHAATQIGSSTYAYDKNGNLTSDGIWTYTWDYRNRLIEASNGTTTLKYGYDHDNNRIWAFDGTATTTYVSKYFNINGSTSTKHVFIGNELISVIQANGLATSTYYVHTDHLGGLNVLTDSSGQSVQLIDYYPFGDLRTDQWTGVFDEQKKFAGYDYDGDVELSYMAARYQNPAIGRFLSINPMLINNINQELLFNPQRLNTYSYARNNPILFK